MKTKLSLFLGLLIFAGSAFTVLPVAIRFAAPVHAWVHAPVPAWQIADGYSIAFSCNEAAGIFRDFKGTLLFDEQHPADAKFDVTIDVGSINTGNGLQNKHAKSDEWFDAAKFPLIHYSSQKIIKAGNGYQSTGDLEMHGVKKQIMIPFSFQRTPKGGQFTGSFMVNRVDFKIGTPGGDVDEQIKIEISVPVTAK